MFPLGILAIAAIFLSIIIGLGYFIIIKKDQKYDLELPTNVIYNNKNITSSDINVQNEQKSKSSSKKKRRKKRKIKKSNYKKQQSSGRSRSHSIVSSISCASNDSSVISSITNPNNKLIQIISPISSHRTFEDIMKIEKHDQYKVTQQQQGMSKNDIEQYNHNKQQKQSSLHTQNTSSCKQTVNVVEQNINIENVVELATINEETKEDQYDRQEAFLKQLSKDWEDEDEDEFQPLSEQEKQEFLNQDLPQRIRNKLTSCIL